VSRERLQELLDSLQSMGWWMLAEAEHPRASRDPFVLEHETLLWALVRGAQGPVVELEFHAFGDLGQRTDDLRDIIDCVELATGRTLDFAKQKSAAWQRNLPRFVNELGGSRKLEP